MDDDITKAHSGPFKKLLYLLLIITLLGAIKTSFWNDGSHTAKYLSKLHTLEVNQDAQAESFLSSSLYEDVTQTDLSTSSPALPLFFESAESYFFLDKVVALSLFVGCLCGFFLGERSRSSRFIFGAVSLYFLSEALCISLTGGKKYSELTLLAHATRWGFPLVLWGLYEGARFQKATVILASICCASTFAIHGWEAWNLNPPFQDLLYRFGALFGVSLPVNSFLKVVGCMDLCLAALVIIKPRREFLLLMLGWGIITALSRPLCMGLEAWPELAIRLANGVVPFIVFFLKYPIKFPLIKSKNINYAMEVSREH